MTNRKRVFWMLLGFWLVLTALLLTWSTMTASGAENKGASTSVTRPLTTASGQREQLRVMLQDNPDVILDFLRQNSETLLDIVQEGAVLRRNKAILSGWQQDLEHPKSINVRGRAMRGTASAPVTIVAFSDFTCPYCEQAAAQMNALLKKYDGKVRYVFKSFPLETHGTARLAAEYYAAASLQGFDKAWKLYDALFAGREHMSKDSEGFLKHAAQSVGLDMKRLATDLKSKVVKDLVEEDLAEGVRLGVDGTPTFFVNDLVVRGAVPDELFTKAIDMALQTAQGAEHTELNKK